ncbi:zinc ribbon domain-containing protein [Natrinema longum]|uniref:zinc ribbon domain-containing protein n=1 Tax=Natrinema longum TaxID=370324 RepID=UPI001CD00CB0|nr:zinc ribbon domain-containing protein [Natrinema longum]
MSRSPGRPDGSPSCGAAVPSSAAYCPACGDDLETGPDRTEGVVRPDCDAVVSEGARYCSACGTKFADAADTPSSRTPRNRTHT